MQSNSFESFDIILEHLLSEGYANDEKSALAIMANMGQSWRMSILEMDASAIAAREKYRANVMKAMGQGTSPVGLLRTQAAQQREKDYNKYMTSKPKKTYKSGRDAWNDLAGIGEK